MKKYLSLVAIVGALMMLTGCTAYKKVPYLKHWEDTDLSPATRIYEAKIMPKDELSIIVNYPIDQEAVTMFNLRGAQGAGGGGGAMGVGGGNQYLLSYSVDSQGYINYPILGRLLVAGMTIHELEDFISNKIKGAYTHEAPIVTVRMANFHVTVIGEVGGVGQVTSTNGQLNIFECLAQCGDISLYGIRDKVKLLREDSKGEKTIVELNLNDADIINSPYYYLQQNDILYVRPSNMKARSADWGPGVTISISIFSLAVTVATLITNLLK